MQCLPMLLYVNDISSSTKTSQVALADDIGAGKFKALREWWNRIVNVGPKFGYYPKAEKSWFIVKMKDQLEEAKHIFLDTNINITIEGRKYLGGFVGNDVSMAQYALYSEILV